jgi:integrase
MITDITRMSGDKVCVAARVDGKSIRLAEPHPRDAWLKSVGGLRPGDLVQVQWRPAKRYRRPHSEDSRWSPAAFAKVRSLRIDELSDQLGRSAFYSVQEAFGKPLFLTEKGNPAFRPDQGARSLATVVARNVSVYPQGDGVRIDFTDARRSWSMVPVEDLVIRQHQQHCSECPRRLREHLAHQYNTEHAILRVGLGRPYQGGNNPLGCYLQVNHIFPAESRAGHFAGRKEVP